MGRSGLIDLIKNVILEKYKSYEEPDFSFVNDCVSNNPYESIINQVGKWYKIKEITDTNDDVSFRYQIASTKSKWVLELSMLGRYAVLLRTPESGAIYIVQSDTSDSDSDESEIIELLSQNKVLVLNKALLEIPINIQLFNTQRENSCVYQALFSDNDLLPWKSTS